MEPVIGEIAAQVYKWLIIRKQIYGQVTGRHKEEDVFHLGKIDLDALSAFLADKPYFMGDKPTSLDASALGILINTIQGPIESPVKEYGKTKKNLISFCDRMMAEFYPELKGETA